MRITTSIPVLILSLAGACMSGNVRTLTAPGPRFAAATYRVRTNPTVRYGVAVSDPTDPMFTNSPANQRIRAAIEAALVALGYRADSIAPDVDIAFYASTEPHVDLTRWSYGYAFIPDWPRWPVPQLPSTTHGQVVIDVLRADSRTLLWRGEGSAALSENPERNIRRIVALATDIAHRIPRAAAPTLVATR